MVIDAHQHFWQFDAVRDTWMDDSMSVLRRDFLPAELHQTLRENGVGGCIAVQADQSETETEFLLGLAAQHDFIRGVVGWVDLRAANLEERLEHFSQYPRLRGFRHIVQGEVDVNFMLRPDFQRGIGMLEGRGFAYDILVFPHQLGGALELARRFPRQTFILDHLGKPYIKDGFRAGWAALLRELGRCENVVCKVSGLVTEADWQHWRYADFVPYLDQAFEAFGPDRLLYGSDWPVCLLGGDYGRVKGILTRYLEPFSPEDRDKVWGGSAARVYGLSGLEHEND